MDAMIIGLFDLVCEPLLELLMREKTPTVSPPQNQPPYPNMVFLVPDHHVEIRSVGLRLELPFLAEPSPVGLNT